MVAAFSTVAGGVASELEEYAAQDQLDRVGPLVAQLETMAQELMRAVDGLSLETLRRQTVGCERLQLGGQLLRGQMGGAPACFFVTGVSTDSRTVCAVAFRLLLVPPLAACTAGEEYDESA